MPPARPARALFAATSAKDPSYHAILDDEASIAASRTGYRRRSLSAAQPYLSVTAETKESVAFVRVVGDLDLTTVLPFRDAAFTLIGTRPHRLVLDLTCLEHLDITGLESLLTVGRVGRMVCVPVTVLPNERVRRLFAVAALSRQLPLENG